MEDQSPESRSSMWRPLAVLLLAFAVCILVWRHAWVSEDSFITFRYVANTVAGLGAVFNTGEYVQGYTHPLWFGLLVIGHWFVPNLIYLSVGLGILLTALTLVVVSLSLLKHSGSSFHGGLLCALFALLCVSSNAWLSFQTSGLENPLSHLLIALLAIEIFGHGFERVFRVTLLGAFLVTTRPDFAFLFLPISLCLLTRLGNPRELRAIALGALPLIAWLAFAYAYYGAIVPNTATAKVGIFPSWIDSATQGLLYLQDWVSFERFPTLFATGLLLFASYRSRGTAMRALLAGIWLQLFYVVGVGGDFMRGRFLLPVFVASLVVGLLTLSAWFRTRSAPLSASAVLLLVAICALPFARESESINKFKLPESGIVDERLYYPGYHLGSYMKRGALKNPYLELGLAEQLKNYAEHCGEFTLHIRNPGTLGFLAGPRVSVIDVLGLTDATIAALPRESLIHEHPRVGHPDKYIPLRYLAARRDIAILKGWKKAVEALDCEFPNYTEVYLESDEPWMPRKLYPIAPSDSPDTPPSV